MIPVRFALVGLLLAGALTGVTTRSDAAPITTLPKVDIRTWTLKNGLKVVFSPHRRVPLVTVQLWYHVGSKNEHRGIRGVAHMFEHLMFKGSAHVRPDEHARMLNALGGTVNAFTAPDLTAYHDTLPQQYLGFALRLEAERMRHLLLTPGALKSEREVVGEEKRKRMENSPIGRALEAIQALAYTSHPYAWTPAGDIGDLERTTMETYRHFYETHYVPNNATLVVVGDVSEKSVRKLAKRYFGAFARGKTPPPICASEPPQKKRRVLNATWASQLNVVLGAYHIPAAKHANIAPLTVLSTILSAGRSSRLHRILVRKKKLAIAAGGFVRELEDPSLFYLYALGLPQHKIATLEKALLAEVDRVQRRPVTAKELQKAKNQLVTGQLHSLESATGVANQIGQSAILQGDPRSFLHDLAELRKVTAADVQRVAKHYLQQANFSVVLLPAGAGKKPSAAKPSAAKPSAAKRGGAR